MHSWRFYIQDWLCVWDIRQYRASNMRENAFIGSKYQLYTFPTINQYSDQHVSKLADQKKQSHPKTTSIEIKHDNNPAYPNIYIIVIKIQMNFAYHFRIITNNSGQFVKYLTIEQDLAALQGQMLYRAKNLGMKQLDLIVGSWATHHVKKMNKQQLLQFNKQVLQQETPDLIRKLLGYQEIDASQTVVKSIRDFAVDDKFSKLDL